MNPNLSPSCVLSAPPSSTSVSPPPSPSVVISDSILVPYRFLSSSSSSDLRRAILKTFFTLRSAFILKNIQYLLCSALPVDKKNWISRETKELSLCNKPNTHMFSTWWCKPLIFQTQIFSSNRIQSLKYLRSTVLGYTDIRIRKSEFVAKTQFLSIVDFDCSHLYKYFSNIWVKSRPSLEN